MAARSDVQGAPVRSGVGDHDIGSGVVKDCVSRCSDQAVENAMVSTSEDQQAAPGSCIKKSIGN